MKKIICILFAVLLCVSLFLTGCSNGTEGNTDSADTVTVTDHLEKTVTLPKNIQRIAVCDIFPLPSVLTVFFGSADKIIAMAPTSMSAAENGVISELYPEIKNADTSAISGADVNTEELLKLQPQVVFYNASNPQLGEKLERAGFNAVAVSVDKWGYDPIKTLEKWTELLSSVFPEKAGDVPSLVKKYSDEAMALVKERTNKLSDSERKNIFFLFQYNESAIVTTGINSFGQWWADSIGANNAAKELTASNSVKVTSEQVYKWNPELIFISNFTQSYPQELYSNAVGSYDWSGIKAVRDREVYKMPLGMYRSFTPGADTPITLIWLAKTVYPELFSDIDITEKTVDYYKTVFGIELTERQAGMIFAPAGKAGVTAMRG